MATLYYNNIEEEDLGTYQCSAEFQFGMLKNTVNFTESKIKTNSVIFSDFDNSNYLCIIRIHL